MSRGLDRKGPLRTCSVDVFEGIGSNHPRHGGDLRERVMFLETRVYATFDITARRQGRKPASRQKLGGVQAETMTRSVSPMLRKAWGRRLSKR